MLLSPRWVEPDLHDEPVKTKDGHFLFQLRYLDRAFSHSDPWLPWCQILFYDISIPCHLIKFYWGLLEEQLLSYSLENKNNTEF